MVYLCDRNVINIELGNPIHQSTHLQHLLLRRFFVLLHDMQGTNINSKSGTDIPMRFAGCTSLNAERCWKEVKSQAL